MEEWKKISEDEISEQFNKSIEEFFNKGITKYIVSEFTKTITNSMMDSFNETFEKIDDYMIEKIGAQVKNMSDEIIKQIKGK